MAKEKTSKTAKRGGQNPKAGSKGGSPAPAPKRARGSTSQRSQNSKSSNVVNAQSERAAQQTEAKAPELKKRKHSRKLNGFAETKEYPHKKHPARFKKKRGSDEIEYITFTHSDKVELNDVIVITKPLTSNITPKERGTLNEKGEPNISYAYPKVYVGKRSALGKGTDKYSLVEADKKIIDELFATLPREEVPKTSNSKKKNKK